MGDPVHAVALTRGPKVPSARFRVGQFVAPLADLGVRLDWRPATVPAYPPARKWLRPFWLPLSVAARSPGLIASHRADVTLFNRELVSTLGTLEGVAGRPRVFDVDDAIFLRRGGRSAAWIARRMDVIIAGNDFLADWFSAHNPEVVVLPTAVDTDRFTPGAKHEREELVVGWTGTSANFPYLESVMPALAQVMAAEKRARFHVSADRPPRWLGLPEDRVRFVPWSPEGEVDFIRSLDLGLMPLPDVDWCRGKCAYKMLLYLACGVPAVSSPVGVNGEILQRADVGRPARDEAAWSDEILGLLADPDGRATMGQRGRDLVVAEYSVAGLAPRLADILKDAAAGRRSSA